MLSASIRYNNPGAMWGRNKISKRWGETGDVVLADGQANHIAIFPSKVNGAAAQFDLWRTSYAGKTLGAAIDRWCGGNSPAEYSRTMAIKSGIGQDEIVTVADLAGPIGLKLVKAQADWEAGQPYPMSEEEWKKAQELVFNRKGGKIAVTTGVVVATATAAAHYSTTAVEAAIFICVGLGIAAFVYFTQWRKL